MEQLFSIGDVSKLFHLSVSSLRHYEALGLLTPKRVDPNTGYRSYSIRQFEVLNTIRYLRALDMPLEEIADFLRDRDVERIEEKLSRQREAVLQRQRELERVRRKIDNRLHQLREARTAVLDSAELICAPACRMVWMADRLRPRSFLDMEASIRRLEGPNTEALVFLGKVGVCISEEHLCREEFSQYDGSFLLLDREDHYDGPFLSLPETQCVRLRFRGSHGDAPARYRFLTAYIRAHSLKITGFSREITLIDNGLTPDSEKFLTEISIPVENTEGQ